MSKIGIHADAFLRCLLLALWLVALDPAFASTCESFTPIDLNQTLHSPVSGAYGIILPSPGILALDLLSGDPSTSRFTLLGQDCELDPTPASFSMLLETPRAAVLEISSPGLYTFELEAQAHSLAAGVRLRNIFVPEPARVHRERRLTEDPPQECSDRVSMTPEVLSGNDFVMLAEAVEERDCDILELTVETTGALIVGT